MKRIYLKACDYCQATGFVSIGRTGGSHSTSVTEICPVCKGNKTITVTEED